MKTLIATLLATAAGASFAAAPTAALNHDPATYRNATQKAESDYQTAVAKCNGMSGNDKDVCTAEARLVRTRAENEALSPYYNSPQGREHVRTTQADAEYAVAKAKCGAKSGADKDDCMNNAKSVHTAALADARSGHTASGGSGATAASAAAAGAPASGTDTRDPARAAAADKCAQMAADAKTGCLVETRPADTAAENAADNTRAAASTAASKTRDAAAVAADKTKAVAATVAEKTKEVAETAVDKTKQAASTVGQKTESVMDRSGDDTRQAASGTAHKADGALDRAGNKTRLVAADTAITTKVKAGLARQDKLDSLGIHVMTERGVVMLSGFVNSKAEADQAVQVAKGVDGVTSVRSAIQVK